MTPTWPSREMLMPACGGTTVLMRRSDLRTAVALSMISLAAGSLAIWPMSSEITTCKAVEFRPLNSLATSLRARTDWLPLSCHPAPDSFCSTCTPNAPNTATTTSQAMRT